MQIVQTDGSRMPPFGSPDVGQRLGRDQKGGEFSHHFGAADQEHNAAEIATGDAPNVAAETPTKPQKQMGDAAPSPPPEGDEQPQRESSLSSNNTIVPENTPEGDEPRAVAAETGGSAKVGILANEVDARPKQRSEATSSPISALIQGLSKTHQRSGQTDGAHHTANAQAPSPASAHDTHVQSSTAQRAASDAQDIALPAKTVERRQNLPLDELNASRTTKQAANTDRTNRAANNPNVSQGPRTEELIAPHVGRQQNSKGSPTAGTTSTPYTPGRDMVTSGAGRTELAPKLSDPQTILASNDKQLRNVPTSQEHRLAMPAEAHSSPVRLSNTPQQATAVDQTASTHVSRPTPGVFTANTGYQVSSTPIGTVSDWTPSSPDPSPRMTEMVWDVRPFAPSIPGSTAPQLHRAELPPAVLQTVVDALRHAHDKPIEIALRPAELGRVRMMMATHESGITVTITADRGDTLDLMRRHADDLGKSLSELGYGDVSFSFERGQHPSDEAEDHTKDGHHTTDPVPSDSTPTPQHTPVTKTIAPTGVITSIDMRF